MESRSVFPNILYTILTTVLLLGAEGFSQFSPGAVASNMAKHGNKTLECYNEATSKTLPSSWENVSSVGRIHEPGANTRALMENTLHLFKCYMVNVSNFPLPEEVTKHFKDIAQKIEHLCECLFGEKITTCEYMPDMKDDYKKQEFVRNLLILYVRWMKELETLLLHTKCKK